MEDNIEKTELEILSEKFGKEYFEKNYGNYGDSELWTIMVEILMRKWGRKPNKVVDFGCAEGWLVKHLRNRGIEAFGVDVSEYAIRKGVVEGVLSKPRIYVDRVEYEDTCKNCEWVVSFETLEHIEERNVVKYIESFRAMSKRGFVGSIYTKRQSKDDTHILIRDRAWWVRLFENHGFVNVPIREVEIMNYPIVREFGLDIFWFEIR